MRVKGPHVTPGYYRRPELTAAAFDDEGFYRIGDAVRFVEEQMRDRVLYFSYSLVAPAPEHRDELGRLLTYVKPDKDGNYPIPTPGVFKAY